MKMLVLLPCLLTGCLRPEIQNEPVLLKGPERELQVSAPKKKALAGRVSFSGLSGKELAGILVIPETGTEVFVPGNRKYEQVDGLWWKGDRERWLKIPDHGEVWIGEAPGEFDGEIKLGTVKGFYRSAPFWALANTMRGGVKEPGWVPDAGRTKSPVVWPWAGN